MNKPTSPIKAPQMEVLNSELVGVQGCLWTLGKLRKEATCRVSGVRIAVGQKAWRPLGNVSNRYERISEPAMEKEIARLAK